MFPFHISIPTIVVPAAAPAAPAAVKRVAVVGCPLPHAVAVVIVVVTIAVTERISELAGKRLALVSVVAPPVLSVSNSLLTTILAPAPFAASVTAQDVNVGAPPWLFVTETAGE